MSVCFVTDLARPTLTADDQLAVVASARRGVTVVPARWDDPEVDWGQYQLIVVRSTWDYHTRPAEFSAWLDRVAHLPLRNSAATIRHNLHKQYLLDLQAAGVPVVPTVPLKRGQRIVDLAAAQGWTEVVVKPAVSAGSWRTYRGDPAALPEAQAHVDAGEAMLLQPFCADVLTRGEWSLVYLGGSFSHALRKVPASGSFYVQEEFGGRQLLETPDAELRALAEKALSAWSLRDPAPLLYARVDLLLSPAGWGVAELELIEPALYLGLDADAPDRLAAAIKAELRRIG